MMLSLVKQVNRDQCQLGYGSCVLHTVMPKVVVMMPGLLVGGPVLARYQLNIVSNCIVLLLVWVHCQQP
jgi:hypothetical protein